MRLDRLLAIVMLLVNRKRIQAKELAEIFEVSIRTVYRDIDAINQAGIPVVTYQGVNGGLGIADNYKIDRNVLCQDDIVSILSALHGLKTTLDDQKLSYTIEKIKGLIPDFKADEYREKSSQLVIDLTPWGDNDIQRDKINLLKQAIEGCRLVSFSYTNAKGENAKRNVESMCLVLKMQTWYLYGFCRNKEDFRLFRLSRIKDLALLTIEFNKKEKSLDGIPWENEWSQREKLIEVTLRFMPDLKALVEEKFETEKIYVDDNGRVMVRFQCPETDWLYGIILSYGAGVEVLEPEHLRRILREKLALMQKIYESPEGNMT